MGNCLRNFLPPKRRFLRYFQRCCSALVCSWRSSREKDFSDWWAMKRDSGQYLGWNAFPNRKADLIRCYHHPHPPQAVPPLPGGEGSLMWRITSLVDGDGTLRTIIPHTLREGIYWEDGFCDFAFGSAQNDRFKRLIAKSKSLRTRETEHKGVWWYPHWLLIL